METTDNMEAEKQEKKNEKREAYDPVKVGSIKKLLELEAQSGQPAYYKIMIDTSEVVKKTCDIGKFDTYQNFLEGAGELIILLYGTAETFRIRSKRIFTLTEEAARPAKPQQELSGTESEIEARVRKIYEQEQLKKDLNETKVKLADAEEYMEELQEKLEKERNRNLLLEKERDLKDKNFGLVCSGVVEGIVRRNTKLIAQIPGAEGLAGFIDRDTKEKEEGRGKESESQGEASFSETPAPTEKEKEAIAFFREMKEHFGEELFDDVMRILEYFYEHEKDIKTVTQLLGLKKENK